MTYYEDLSPYEYFADSEPLGLQPVNVGWLDENKPFPKGETSLEFKARLFEFRLPKYVVHSTRGVHTCQFCNVSDHERYEQSKERYGEEAHWLSIYEEKAQPMSLGNGEIRVIGQSTLYAAPTLIHHYVVEHNYKPPDEFIEAVLEGPAPGSKEHETWLKKYR
jgi:hypothetical protein